MSNRTKIWNWSKTMTALILCISPTIADVSSLSKNYLPAEEGYSYKAPSISFSTPAPSFGYKPTVTIAPRPPIPKYSTAAPPYSPPITYRPSSPTIYTSPKSAHVSSSHYDYEGGAISSISGQGAGTGGGEFDHLRQPHVPGMPYDFSYAVKDDYYGTDFGHSAVSDGDQVRGEYRVALPDGRLQIVKYIADWKDGYTAEVTYQGEAKYPTGSAGGDYSGRSLRPYPSQNSNYQRPPSYSGSGYSGSHQSGYSTPKTTSYIGYNSQRSDYAGRSSGYSASSSGYGVPQQQSYSSPAPNYSSGPDYGGY